MSDMEHGYHEGNDPGQDDIILDAQEAVNQEYSWDKTAANYNTYNNNSDMNNNGMNSNGMNNNGMHEGNNPYGNVNYSYRNIYADPVSPGGNRGRGKKKGGGFKKFVKLVASALVFGIVAGSAMTGISLVKDHFIPTNLSKVEVTEAAKDNKEDGNDKTTGSAVVTTEDVSGIVEQVMPSVVSITCTMRSSSSFYGTRESQGAGSGFILAKNNKMLYIATNNHVVNGAVSLTVGFSDGTTCPAEIIGTDSDADLAVIAVKESEISKETAGKIKIAVLGDSDELKVGEPVIAIGNALGYGQSVTTGVLSAKDREVSFTDGTMVLLQTDAAINPGNSGGVLINRVGHVIGINNAKLEDTSVEGMGYAIPMSTAKKILSDLMNATSIKEEDQAFLGVVGKNIDAQYSQALGMPSGIYVSQVVSGSPAEAAGISAGDIIVGIDGNNLSTMTGLKDKISRKEAGSKVEITLKRSNQNGEYEEQKITVTLGKKGDFADDTTESDEGSQQQNPYQDGQDYGNEGDYYFNPFDFFFGNGGNGYYYQR